MTRPLQETCGPLRKMATLFDDQRVINVRRHRDYEVRFEA